MALLLRVAREKMFQFAASSSAPRPTVISVLDARI
jgi:hypothetical protein